MSIQPLYPQLRTILSTDFHDLMEFMETNPSLDWIVKKGDSDQLLEELFRYLFLLTQNEDLVASPSGLIDEALHCLLLDPILYYRVCDALLTLAGKNRPIRLLPHNPLNGKDKDARAARYNETIHLYRQVFNSQPPCIFWPDNRVGTCEPFRETPSEEITFQIQVQTLNGEISTILVGSVSETVLNLKHRINAIRGIGIDEQRLIFEARQLEDDMLLPTCNITNGSTVHLIPRLRC